MIPDVPDGWATIVGLIITAIVGPSTLAILGVLLNRKVNKISAATNATLHQVKNSHEVNLRDDQDDKHAELVGLVTSVRDQVKTQGRDIGGLRGDMRELRRDQSQLREEFSAERERIRDLEDTRPQSQRPRRPQKSKE